jgi:hypothetical protein
LVTVSVYGFWWWYDVNRQLRTVGQPARPWRSLGEVTLGLVAVAPGVVAGWPWVVVALSPIPVGLCLLSVRQTSLMLVAAQQVRGLRTTASAPLIASVAAVALVGAVAWYALAVLEVPGFMLVGVLWPCVAMVFVGYVQAQLNTLPGATR